MLNLKINMHHLLLLNSKWSPFITVKASTFIFFFIWVENKKEEAILMFWSHFCVLLFVIPQNAL